jgi:hypothetical protein
MTENTGHRHPETLLIRRREEQECTDGIVKLSVVNPALFLLMRGATSKFQLILTHRQWSKKVLIICVYEKPARDPHPRPNPSNLR